MSADGWTKAQLVLAYIAYILGCIVVFAWALWIHGALKEEPWLLEIEEKNRLKRERKETMTIWQILAELFTLVQQYGPAALTIITTAETYIVAGNWSGLLTYLESLLNQPTPPIPATLLRPHVDKLRAALRPHVAAISK